MSLVINTNAAATAASNNLAASNQALQRSLNRLSSGSKIVSPADDAGGLAVSMKLSAAAKRQGAAITNVANSTSYLQTQDGALKVAGQVLDRISELKTLSTDPTKSSSDIANYNVEFEALQDQLTSIGGETFNGVALFGSSTFDVATTESGGGAIAVGGIALLAASNSISEGFSSLSAWTNNSTGTGSATLSGGALVLTTNGGGNNGRITSNQSFDLSTGYDISYDASSSTTSTTIDIMMGSDNLLSVAPADTLSHTYRVTYDGTNWEVFIDGSSVNSGTMSISPAGPVSLVASGTGQLTVDNFTLGEYGGGGGGSGSISNVTNAASLTALDLSTVTTAIQDLATHRATNGAQQSRLGFAAELLSTNKANLEAATSRIVDVDVATESTMLARQNILVQSGTAMLAQANQSTQGVLRLLN